MNSHLILSEKIGLIELAQPGDHHFPERLTQHVDAKWNGHEDLDAGVDH